jgi:hypothetical protein
MVQEQRLSEEAKQILKSAREYDYHFSNGVGVHRKAYNFWSFVDTSRLNPYDKQQLGRYALHSSFEQAIYVGLDLHNLALINRTEKHGLSPVLLKGATELGYQIKTLAKRFGMGDDYVQRWIVRASDTRNWERKRIRDWGRSLMGSIRPGWFWAHERMGKRSFSRDSIRDAEIEYAYGDKLRAREMLKEIGSHSIKGIETLLKKPFDNDSIRTCGKTEKHSYEYNDLYQQSFYDAQELMTSCEMMGMKPLAKILGEKSNQLQEFYVASHLRNNRPIVDLNVSKIPIRPSQFSRHYSFSSSDSEFSSSLVSESLDNINNS